MEELLDWLSGLDPVFAFLLALPFLVAAAAAIGELVRFAWRVRAAPRAHEARRPRLHSDEPVWH